MIEGIALGSGAVIPVNLSLRIGAVPQDVTVSADVAIDTTTSTVSGAIAERSLTDLPLNGRDLFKAAILQPGVAPTPSSAPSLLVERQGRPGFSQWYAPQLDECSHRRYGCK